MYKIPKFLFDERESSLIEGRANKEFSTVYLFITYISVSLNLLQTNIEIINCWRCNQSLY